MLRREECRGVQLDGAADDGGTNSTNFNQDLLTTVNRVLKEHSATSAGRVCAGSC